MKKLVRSAASFGRRNSRKIAGVAILGGSALCASAQTDATVIATNALSAFDVVAPIVVTIAGFFVILKIVRRAH
jgi:hypothetical protein